MSSNLTWTEMQPGWSWRSTDGQYVILRAVLPDPSPRPTETYTVRKSDPAMESVRPGYLGYFIQELLDLDGAQRAAGNDAHHSAHARSNEAALNEMPSLETVRFFWPISNGTTRAALTVQRDGNRIVARVVGMCRGEDDYAPGTYAEIDITALAAATH